MYATVCRSLDSCPALQVLPASYLTDSIFGSLCSSKQKVSSALKLDRLASDSERLVKLFVVGEVNSYGAFDWSVASY